MAHVATWKKELVKEMVQSIVDSPLVAVVDMHGIQGPQLQSMRAVLRGHATVKMAKNNLMLLALDEASKSKPGIEGLKEAIHGQCAIVTSDLNPFKLFKQLDATMTPAAAKAGEIAPFDIVVPKGPTPFGPGPIIGELQKIGLPAAIEAGKIVIRKDTTLVKEGEPFPDNVAKMLPKLEILPMIVGLGFRSAFEDGTIYGPEVLDIPENYYYDMFATAGYNALALGVAIAFPTVETVPRLVAKAFREALGLAVSAAIPTKDSIELLLSKAECQMVALSAAAGYTSDAIAAKTASRAAAPAPEAAPVDEAKVEEETEKDDQPSEEETASFLGSLFG